MIDRLFETFRKLNDELSNSPEQHDDTIRLSAAALMFEVARSDGSKQDIELNQIESILIERFGISSEAVRELMTAASEKVEAAHDLYQFTQLVNETYSYEEKQQLILAMWHVAFADDHVDSIEDHIIRRVAGLLHVSHGDFIQLKIKARDG